MLPTPLPPLFFSPSLLSYPLPLSHPLPFSILNEKVGVPHISGIKCIQQLVFCFSVKWIHQLKNIPSYPPFSACRGGRGRLVEQQPHKSTRSLYQWWATNKKIRIGLLNQGVDPNAMGNQKKKLVLGIQMTELTTGIYLCQGVDHWHLSISRS